MDIFQTEQFSAVKFDMGYEKKNDQSCDFKISKSFKQKLKKSDWVPLICVF